ncbi:ATP-binding protein [Isoptericola cucumis]|uniref:ATP-binding protein n=1 Tax=Isoptericola cucumis TaxID=1776856 RepID=A0ABQ2B741_9MICO|nr:ATP-binding protein [Isoptericola cucumis]
MTRRTRTPASAAPAEGVALLVPPAPVSGAVAGVRPSGAGAGRARLVLVGGVPGAGKSTALARMSAAVPGVRVLDSEAARRRLRGWFPQVPYPVLRPLVHTWHGVQVLRAVAAGPGGVREASGGWVLLVHDPGTRRLRRGALALLARVRGWSPVLVMLDVGLDEARRGQHERGRVVRGGAFGRHWRRWEAQRARLVRASTTRRPAGGWDAVHVVDRRSASTVLEALARQAR